MEKFVTILTANMMSDLIVAKSLLHDADIDTRIPDEFINQVNPLYSNAFGGLRLQVSVQNAEVALEILKEGGFTGMLEQNPVGNDAMITSNVTADPVACPHCGSSNISKLQLSKTAFALSVLLLGFQLPFYSKKRFCYDCRNSFRSGA